VVKINHQIEPIPSAPPSGYRELIVAQTSRSARLDMADPDGNAVSVIPPAYHCVKQIGIRMGVRDLDAHRHFYINYINVIGLQDQSYPLGAAFRAGDTVIFLEQKPGVVVDAGVYGLGWRYITFGKLDAMMCGWIVPSNGSFPNRASLKPKTLSVCLGERLRARLLRAASVCD
jgi:hypothetical protein